MSSLASSRARQDADAIYERAYEWHGVISVEDAHELGRDWKAASRVALAIRQLVDDGFMRFETFRGRRYLKIVKASDMLESDG